MNDQTNMAQLRYLEELKISLVHAGFEPERIEDQHLPVCWEKGRLCQISGRGSVLYRQENVDGIGAQDALQSVIHIAAMTAEYMTGMGRAPKLHATGLEGDYRILADFGGTVLAGTPSKHGVQFVTWDWDYDRTGVSHGHDFMENYRRPLRLRQDHAVQSHGAVLGCAVRQRTSANFHCARHHEECACHHSGRSHCQC